MPDPECTNLVGGYYVWLKLLTLHVDQVCQEALEAQILLLGEWSPIFSSKECSSRVDWYQSLRLCFMLEDEENLFEDVNRSAIVISVG